MITLNQLNEELKKHDLELYDFGDSVTVMPIIDRDGSYLTKSIIFVIKKDSYETAMGIEIPHNLYSKGTYLVNDGLADKIAIRFEECSRTFESGEPLPREWTTIEYIESDIPPKPKLSERETAVRKAIANLARHGLRITGLKCHPITVHHIVSEELQVIERPILASVRDVTTVPKDTYCGIPLEQDANEPTPIP